MLNTLVIDQKHGGLGDHLFFSPLPRIAKEAGVERVLISDTSQFRSREIRELVWSQNPHIDGFTDQRSDVPECALIEAGENILDRIMLLHGLDDGKRYHEPEIAYVPSILDGLKDEVIFDPNYISYVGEISEIAARRLLEPYRPTLQMAPNGRTWGALPGVRSLKATSLFHYCDIIASCRSWICLTSGGATLAAALGKPSVVLYGEGQNTMFHHSRLHRYVKA